MEAQDKGKIRQMLEDRSRPNKRGETPFLDLDGPAAADLFCEGSASAKDVGLKALSSKLWARALEIAPLSKCVRNNWGLLNPGKTFDEVFSQRDQVRAFFSTGMTHEVGSHNGPAVRFLKTPQKRHYLLDRPLQH